MTRLRDVIDPLTHMGDPLPAAIAICADATVFIAERAAIRAVSVLVGNRTEEISPSKETLKLPEQPLVQSQVIVSVV